MSDPTTNNQNPNLDPNLDPDLNRSKRPRRRKLIVFGAVAAVLGTLVVVPMAMAHRGGWGRAQFKISTLGGLGRRRLGQKPGATRRPARAIASGQ